MTRLLSSVALAALVAGAAGAQETVRVRVGEHPSYSRIVIDAPRGAAFDWGFEGDRLRVTLREPGMTFAAAPSTRGLSRVAGLSAEGDALVATVSGDSGARAARLSDGRIVIDVAEGAPRPAAPDLPTAAETAPEPGPETAPGALAPAPRPAAAETATAPTPEPETGDDAAPMATERTEADLLAEAARLSEAIAAMAAPTLTEAEPPSDAPAATETEAAAAPGPQPMPESETADQPEPAPEPQPAAIEAPAAAEVAAAPAPAPADPHAAAIEAARQRLLEQLTRAAEEGLVTLAPRTGPDAETRGSIEIDPFVEPQLRARNAIDIARGDGGVLDADAPELPKDCLEGAHFAAAAWGTDAPFGDQISQARARLVGEFDEPQPGAVVGYARLLIHFGLGIEARAALAAFGDTVAEPPALAEMSWLVDGEAPPEAGVLSRNVGCPGPHGAWGAAAAARRGELTADQIDIDALRPAIGALPPRLRPALVAPIAAVALDAGDVRLAEQVAAIAARALPEAGEPDEELALIMARIDHARGEIERAEEALAAIARRSTPGAVEAMILLVDLRLGRDAPPPPGLAENMEAVAFTLGTSDYARRLLAAAARARAASEGLRPALEALSSLAGRSQDPDAARHAAQGILASYAPRPEEAPDYAEAVLAHWSLVGDGGDGDAARLAVSRRLADMGVENLAESLLKPAVERGEPEARVLAARAATAAGAPERALGYLGELGGAEAQRARAEALSALGRDGEAADAARAAGDPAMAARYAWLARNWAAASAAGQIDRRIIAAWMAGATETPPELRAAVAENPALEPLADMFNPADGAPDDGDLVNRAEAALEAARRRRETMGGLLTDG
jgi:hypothetical protein